MTYLVRGAIGDEWHKAEGQIINREEGCASTFIGEDGFLFIVKSEDWEERVKIWKKQKEK